MKVLRALASYESLREQPLWKLLAGGNGPIVLALFQGLFPDGVKALAASVIVERLSRELEDLRAAGKELPQTAQAYLANWLSQGWLHRRLAPGASEESYELTAESLAALRFVSSALKPRTLATESRLSVVMQQLSRLAQETDDNPASRLESLQRERQRIDAEIEAVLTGGVKTLAPDRALERVREIIALGEELSGDFRSVRNQFEALNMNLRQSIMEHEGSRAEVLESLFSGVDLIGESDAGKTFSAFWKLLTDQEQSQSWIEALEVVTQRPFARALAPKERQFLYSFTETLLNEGNEVHKVLQHFARSLKSFVQSREYLEHRRINTLLKSAVGTAISRKDELTPRGAFSFTLPFTGTTPSSVSQISMYVPTERLVSSQMQQGEASDFSMELIADLVRDSEIDMRTLRENIAQALRRQSQISVAELVLEFGAPQGLGSLVGYVSLATQYAQRIPGEELVYWGDPAEDLRRASIPKMYFMKERYADIRDAN